ncbi:MAG: hypothetical protein WA749_13845 [Gelidibacter sp.]
MNTETQTPVQSQLLWVDEKNLKKERINVVIATTALNRFMLVCETILKGELSPEYKNDLRERKMAALMEEVKKKFKFPDATEKFNLESLGIDLDAAKKLASTPWPYQYELDDMGLFVANENQSVYEHYHYYAVTEKKQKAIEIARKLVELTDEARAIGLLDSMHLRSVGFAFQNIVRMDLDSGPNQDKIKVYNEEIALYIR